MIKLTFFFAFLLTFSFMKAQNFSASNVQQPTCFGMCNGSVTFTTSAVTGPFNMVMTNSASCPNSTMSSSSNSAITITSVCPCASDYTVSIFSGTIIVGVDYVQFPITSTAALSVNVTSVAPTSCSSCCTGSANITWSGGNTQINSPTITINGSPTSSYSPASGLCAGVHTVCATDAASCTTCQSFTISSTPVTGIRESEQTTAINFYPNPATDELNIESEKSFFKVELMDITGRKITSYSNENRTAALKLNTSSLSEGIYYLEIYHSDNSIQRKKFAKKQQ